MRPRRSVVMAVSLCFAVACSSTTTTSQGTTSTAPGATPSLGFVAGAAENADGVPPSYTAVSTCGSDSATFLAELATTTPDKLKVMRQWADIVPGGKQIMITGTLASSHLGPQDLPTSHTFGDDLSMNVKLDPQFAQFSKLLGKTAGSQPPAGATSSAAPTTTSSTAPPSTTTTTAKVDETDNGHVGEDKSGYMHVEISAGLIPHVARPANANGQSWRDLSDFNLTGFQPGLKKPAVGDRVAVMGRWIIDCGHANFSTELHPITFLAWTHQQGDRTEVHFYQNPFSDSQIYSPDASVLGKTADASRHSNPANKPFPSYFIDEVVRLIGGKAPQLRSQQMIDATVASPADWTACAPSARSLRVDYDIVARQGATVTVSKPDASGCVTVHSGVGAGYQPADAVLHTCALPWSYLDEIARGAVADNSLNVRAIIKRSVLQQFWPAVDRDPVTSCGDALAGPQISTSPSGQNLNATADQPFPYYGTITLTPTK